MLYEGAELGIREARSELGADLRAVASAFYADLHALRCEVRAALGLPPLAGPDQGTLQ